MKPRKKKAIRSMRKGAVKYPDGTTASHKMSWVGDETKRRGKFGVFPTIKPKPGKETSSDPKDWQDQNPKQAMKSGEFIPVKRRKRAEKLAAGSWKKGIDKREAMREYRAGKTSRKKTK